MKKLLFFIAFAVGSSLFSCTADEDNTQAENKIEKIKAPSQAGSDQPDGPGDGKVPPPKKP